MLSCQDEKRIYFVIVEKNTEAEIRRIDRRIREIKARLQEIGDMRPGSLTRQYRVPQERIGAYFQISYTHQMKSRTEYVRPENVAKIRKEIATCKRFKKLITEWTGLAIQQSILKINLAKAQGQDR